MPVLRLVIFCFAFLLPFAPRATAARLETNRALRKLSIQTSTGWGGDPARAVDGNTDGNYPSNSVTHTQFESQPYWQIDLGGSYLIDRLEIFNRTDCCSDRLRDVFVFFSNEPMTLRGASDTFQQQGVQSRLVFGQLAAKHVVAFGQRARYVRIQLAGDGYLSLAEVQAIEGVDVDGPAKLAAATTWVPTGVYTPASAFSLAQIDGALSSLQRGFDGTLHIAADIAVDRAVPGSPQITAEAPAVAVDPATNRVFVAVRGASGGLHVATGEPGSPRTWSWTQLATTQAAPALVVTGDKVVVAWLEGSHVRSSWKPTGGGAWASPTIHIDATTPPTLARNKTGAVGMAFLRWNGSINFIRATPSQTALAWGTVQVITGWSNGGRAGITAWGERFVVSALGGDARPYVAIEQQQNGVFTWNGFEPAWGAADVPLSEAPTVAMFSGVMFVFARDQNKALRYWIRNPNTLEYRYAAGQMWLGGRIVSGWGTGATPPALAAIGSSTVWGVWGSPSEYFVATRGIGDSQIYALNVGRFVALDVLTSAGITLRGNESVPELDVRTIRNLFEHMVALLVVPGANAWTANAKNPACSPATAGVHLLLHPDTAGQTRAYQCPPVMYLNASYQDAFFMFHEWMHMDHARRSQSSRSGYATAFGNPAPKQCTTDADCGGDVCRLADEEFGWFADAGVRQWIGKKVCVAGDRPQGHVTYYALESAEHDFIETAQRYRFAGETLRQQAIDDLWRGNSRLWTMYVWLRDNYFDGIEYNGNGDGSGERSNRNFGWWAMPSK